MPAIVTMLVMGLLSSSALRAIAVPKTFPTAQAAVESLDQAVNNTNRAAFRVLFGAEADWLANPDTVQGARDLAEFAAAFNVTNRLVRESDTNMTLEVGSNAWPFPIPLVKTTDGWSFDAEAGKEEILSRRIGKNELATLAAIRAYVDAQREYASRDRTGDEVLEYAQRLFSSPGKKDGLYWPPELDGEISPLGPLMAEAQGLGYTPKTEEAVTASSPFHGYYFRILLRQGKHAAGGKYGYVINGHMIGGFGMVAWPASYGESGIMTFIVNQQGRVYQKDHGPNTDRVARKMKAYDPDPTWQLSPD